jgi:hypothetical protein
MQQPQPMPDQQRSALLAEHLRWYFAQGCSVESQMGFQVILVKGNKPVNHVLHLLITLLTCGAWGVVWIGLSLTAGQSRQLLTVDEWGNVTLQPAPRLLV